MAKLRVPVGLRIDRGALGRLSEVDRAKALRALEAAAEAVQANPLLAYQPHAKQELFHAAGGKGSIRLLSGGNRGGKTTGGILDDLIQCVDREAVPEHLLRFKTWDAPFRCRVVTVDFKQSHDVILEKLQEWVPTGQLKGGTWRKAYDKLARRLWFKNGSFIELMSQEQEFAQFQGADRHRVHFDEEPKHDHGRKIWRECAARVAEYDGEMVLTMTPLEGMSWVYDDIYLPATEGTNPLWTVVTMSTLENPHVDPAGMKRFFATLSGSPEELAARQHGQFVALEGQVFKFWDPSRHVIDPLDALPPVGPQRRFTVVGIDPGAANPRVVAAFRDDAGLVIVFDEIVFPQGAPISEVCAAVLKLEKRWGILPNWRVIDPSARQREQSTGLPVLAEYAKNKVACRLGDNNRTTGIGRMNTLLKADMLKVTRNCVELRKEFPKNRWPGSKRSENGPKESPVKRDDHSLDGTRYIVMSLPEWLAPEPRQGDLVFGPGTLKIGGGDQGPDWRDGGPGVFA